MGVHNPDHTKGQLPKEQRWLYDPIVKRLPDNQGGNGQHKDPYRAMQAGGLVVAGAGLLCYAGYKLFGWLRDRNADQPAEA